MNQNRELLELEIEDEYRERILAGEKLDPGHFLKRFSLPEVQEQRLLLRLQNWAEPMTGFQDYYESIDHDSAFRNILKELRIRKIAQMPNWKDKKPEEMGTMAAASDGSEIEALRGTIGAVFNTHCPITFRGYDARLYIKDENSVSLELEKNSQITSDLEGTKAEFSLAGVKLHYTDFIRNGEITIDFGRLGATIRNYRELVIKMELEDVSVEIHLDKFEAIIKERKEDIID
jgi:hypothetical protein